jgi:hypothetical protein
MNIDFPPPSKGTYNNAGGSRKLCNYLEHEDMERMEQGIYTEGFFNLTDDNIYKSQVIKDIDSNIGQLLKTDAKFYAIHVSPSEQELRAMGNTEAEQAEARFQKIINKKTLYERIRRNKRSDRQLPDGAVQIPPFASVSEYRKRYCLPKNQPCKPLFAYQEKRKSIPA